MKILDGYNSGEFSINWEEILPSIKDVNFKKIDHNNRKLSIRDRYNNRDSLYNSLLVVLRIFENTSN